MFDRFTHGVLTIILVSGVAKLYAGDGIYMSY
jgi:hypothetical protein